MHQTAPDFKTYPPIVIGAVSSWEDWKALHTTDLTQDCDWVELRMDSLPADVTMDDIMAYAPNRPILFTARPPQEGGILPMSDERRHAMLEASIPYAAAIDVEVSSLPAFADLIEKAHAAGVTVVASAHDFDLTPGPDYMLDIEERTHSFGVDITKIAFRLIDPSDIQNGVEFLLKAKGDVAIMGMGITGPTVRLLYSQLGSCLIYGYLGSKPTARGQWPARDFKAALSKLHPVTLR